MDLKNRRLKSFGKMKDLITGYYMNAKWQEGNPDQKIAWVTSGGPVEPLVAMNVIPIYPENHGALIGAAKMGPALTAEAEKRGFSPDICSYARCDFGQIHSGNSPVGGLPKPDFLVCCNNICGTVLKWYEEVARIYKVPLLMFDTPFLYEGDDEDAFLFVEAQVRRLCDDIARIVGRPFDWDNLKNVTELSREGIGLWDAVLSKGRNKPAPMSCFDAFIFLAPIVTLRGTQVCNDFYKGLLAELDERIAAGFGAIPDEKHRVIWDNLPIWYEMHRLSETLADFGTCMVADTYTNAWADNEIDETAPIEGLARTYAKIHLNRPIGYMAEKMMALAKKFDAGGVIMHSNRSCKPYSFGQYDMQRIITEKAELPVMIIDADMNDPRQFDWEETKRKLEEFVGML